MRRPAEAGQVEAAAAEDEEGEPGGLSVRRRGRGESGTGEQQGTQPAGPDGGCGGEW